MEGEVGGGAITPRAGRLVEIQALWYNALRTLEEFGRPFADYAAADYYAGIAQKLQQKFDSVFWNKEARRLFDGVGDSGADAAVSPNQGIANCLAYCLVAPDL